MKHFLSINDLTKDEVEAILDKTAVLKRNPVQPLLKDKTLAMIFEKTSTRTRISFEVGMFQLGGHALYLNKNDIQLGHGETVADTAQVLSRYVDFIAARVYAHQTLEDLAAHATVPVINLLSDREHPCQIVADLFTIREQLGTLQGKTVAWVGDGNNVCHSLLLGCSLLGATIKVATPPRYAPLPAIVKRAQKNAAASGAEVVITTSPAEAVKEADAVYNDTFVSMGQEKETDQRLRDFKDFVVTAELMRRTNDAVYLHCLPNYHVEVTDEVFYSDRSVVWGQAENRLHAQKALLLFLR